MTAPDPTAGEPLCDGHDPLHCYSPTCPIHSVSPPAVAASTGTSEDVEAPNVIQRIVNAWDCCGTCAGGVLARHVADREAAARAEANQRADTAFLVGARFGRESERERIAQAIEAERDLDPRTPFGLGLASAAHLAREGR